jgi:hypothetical protein
MQVSNVQQRGAVPFPAFTGERVYMREFTKAAGLPPDLLRWQDTVDAMLDGVDTRCPIFLMVDQAPVKAATTQRRPGLHVDGYWHPSIQGHRHIHTGDAAEGLIIASNVLGCAGYVGRFEGSPGEGGDCAHIDASGLLRVDMEPGRAWAGHTLTMLHEALPVRRDCLRTVVRLNVRGWGAA